MKIKTFNAAQLSEAIAEIKKELGEDALILSTKEVEFRKEPNQPPVKGYEVVAAGDPAQTAVKEEPREARRPVSTPAALAARKAYQAAPPAPPAPVAPLRAFPPSRAAAGPILPPALTDLLESAAVRKMPARPAAVEKVAARETEEPEKPANPAPPPAAAGKTPDSIAREMIELKRLIRWSAQSVVSSRFQSVDPDADALFIDLIANDMDESIARKIVTEARKRMEKSRQEIGIDSAAREVFREMVQIVPIDERFSSRTVAIFLGPTGVGKTTTIAKLASRFALELGRKTLLITLDTYRIGAAEQLRIYADLIGIPLLVANSVRELDRQLREHTEAEVILIDTVGRAHGRLFQLADLAEYVKDKDWIEKHLVLSLTTKPLDLRETIEAYEMFGTNKLLFTKLDETITNGTAANELIRTQKPLAYMTNGQNVPQDIQIPTPGSFAEFIISREQQEDLRMAYA